MADPRTAGARARRAFPKTVPVDTGAQASPAAVVEPVRGRPPLPASAAPTSEHAAAVPDGAQQAVSAAFAPLELLRQLDGWMQASEYGADHPWRRSIAATLGASRTAASCAESIPVADHAAVRAAPAPHEWHRPFSTRGAIHLLYERADNNLTRAEREQLASGCAELVATLAGRAATVAEGIGCLVMEDGSDDSAPGAGNFQSSHDVPHLLWHFAETFRHIEAMSALVSLASEALEIGGNR